MDKPETITLPVTPELWAKIVDHAKPEDEDDVVKFVTDAVLEWRDPWDYDSPWD